MPVSGRINQLYKVSVYKFYPAKRVREALIEQRLKVSLIDELNDPLEYFSLDFGDQDIRVWASEFRRIVSQKCIYLLLQKLEESINVGALCGFP